MASENRDIWVKTKSSDEHFSSHQNVLDQVINGVAHAEDADSVEVDIVPLKGADSAESDLVLSTEVGHVCMSKAYSHDDIGVVT